MNDITLTALACVGASVTYAVNQNSATVLSGSMTDTGGGNFAVIISGLAALLNPPLSAVQFVITISGCGGPPDGTVTFDAYIDPSGFTRYIGGAAAVGATVTLLKGPSPFGPFAIVPDGSAIMSPKNRVNPDVSDSLGHFGWDVLSGFYKVTAEVSGCVVESAALTIPPAVTDLELEFQCPCVAGPRAGCRSAEKGQLTIKDNTDDTKDSFSWKWSAGEATTFAELGTPMTTTAYDVCVYTGVNDDELTRLRLPALAGWQTAGSGYKYVDSLRLSTGVTKAGMKPGGNGVPKLQIKGKGARLPDATLGSLPTPVTIQLQPSDLGVCFESQFGSSDVLENGPAAPKLKFP